MAIPYANVINILENAVVENFNQFARDGGSIPITSAVGRICRDAYYSPASTPSFDSSAMDGFAVNSEATRTVSPDNPIVFCVQGTIAAGDAAPYVSASSPNGFISCVEIMTGAQFPICSDARREKFFGACIKVEDTTTVTGPDPTSNFTQTTKPAHPGQNRRRAGSDLRAQDLVINPGATIKPHHVMALTALGTKEVVIADFALKSCRQEQSLCPSTTTRMSAIQTESEIVMDLISKLC